ncbi:Na/Pi cotransporter family protein [Draconibacterium sp. IB214405]|uniref:Na/Pi cotransporter family protein n=1 Tax=Draconibacterium sp. IB214405 TaxID=3097352 RepID=UPI002A17852A|nr:Na/Pi cotransporter family protein [Draconibacterium sp. IB214405]MDX8339534.1 Na/Pi cotransporter family protein [Draconibacterium sp. IB214405]
MNFTALIILLLGGLALFLHGMNVMTDGLKAAAGSRMKTFLQGMTHNRWTSLVAGTGITAIIQSSSVTTVLAVGFVSAGLITFQSTLGIILGANVGTTITAQIIAFKIAKASWVMIAVGFLSGFLFKKKVIKNIGTIVLGLGLVFLGMSVMSDATAPLKSYEPFIDLMEGLDNYVYGIIIGAVFTALVQSSSATTGIVIIMASQGLIDIEPAISIILGANIGTCVTAVLSALGKPKAAMRVAVSHILFNVLGVVIWYAFIAQLAHLVENISPGSESRQVANAHTIFNLANTILFIWLVKPIAKLVVWLVPEKKVKEARLFPELHNFYLEDIGLALDLSHSSVAKLGEKVLEILKAGIPVALTGKEKELVELRNKDAVIDKGHAEILIFLQNIQSQSITKEQTSVLERQIEAVNVLETAADMVTTTLVEAAEHRIEKGFDLSNDTLTRIALVHQMALDAFEKAVQSYHEDETSADESLAKDRFKLELQNVRLYLVERLSINDENRIETYRFESEILEGIRRIHALARRLKRKAG